ncbi:MAG: S46 family peptidase [Lentimicrobiaceae bacterium]|nr:S46 family peptidase [Lentimicrobiaceae bacterium]
MKKTFLFVALAIFSLMGKVRADEGMWLPMFVERLNYVDMQKMGLQLTPEELYSINNSSLKDAIVGLSEGATPRGFFCTGEIVSQNSLMFTNHHCGYNAIQKLSTVEHDYLTDGFWAKDFSEELPAEGISASFLVRMEDVTEQVLSVVKEGMTWEERNAAIKAKSTELEAAASEDGKYNPIISAFFEGNEYYMFVYRVYTDVRLVGTPPSSIGKFGGDTDNWMWPRHTGDFSIFRVYADVEGNPAPYSPDNKPLTPKHHLPISLDGIQQDDFTMIWGFPGSTERYITSYGIDYNVESFYPTIHEIFKLQTDIMDEFMQKDASVNIMYADDKAGLANTWKNFEGQMLMLRKNKVAETKADLETMFTQWINADPGRVEKYGNVLNTLAENYELVSAITPVIYYPNYAGITGPVANAAMFSSYIKAYKDANSKKDEKGEKKTEEQMAVDKAKLAQIEETYKAINVDAMFAETYKPLEDKTFIEMLKLCYNTFDAEVNPEFYNLVEKKYKGDVVALANDILENSIFATPESIKAFIEKPNMKAAEKDLAYVVCKMMIKQINDNRTAYNAAMQTISENNHLFVKGLREFYAATQPEKDLYPDANSSLRMSYGSVQDYQPADAISYDYICTANGIVEKYVPGDYEFDVPQRLLDLIEARDFGQYADENGELVVCFLSTNDITGGNSGSPIMNGKGELIGLAFDGNWEAMSGDINFEPRLQRTINVDARYVLFVIDKFAGATNLIEELTIVKSEPEVVNEECTMNNE